jgi:putative ABC transport system permease protein
MSRAALALDFAARQLRGDAIATLVAATMLGIGAGTISFVVSLGAMAAAEATKGLEALGPRVALLALQQNGPAPPKWLDPASARADLGKALGADDLAALGVGYGPVRAGRRTEQRPIVLAQGPLDDLLSLRLGAGAWPSSGAGRECAIGSRVADEAGAPEVILIGGRPCRVVGVLAPAGRNALLPVEFDRAVLLAFGASAGGEFVPSVSHFVIRMPDGQDSHTFGELARRYAGIAWPAVTPVVRGTAEMIAALHAQYERQAMLYAAVAAVAVAAAAIGLGCLMLSQVRARRRELGVRLAIGALPGDIVAQVLTEASLLGLAGGIAGNLGAFLLAAVVAAVSGLDLAFDLPVAAATVALTLAAGALAGALPAISAARTDPVHSIRS